MELQPSADQQRAIDAVQKWLSSSHRQTLTLGGHAGTGKTTVVSKLVNLLGRDCVRVCAYTGKAASVLCSKHVDATTMHSLIYVTKLQCSACDAAAYKEGDFFLCSECHSDVFVERINFRVKTIDASLVIVDESSMLTSKLVADLESFGIKTLYVGDHAQLEPIGDDPGIMANPELLLKEIHRQALGSDIISFAHMLRCNGSPSSWRKDGAVTVRRGGIKNLLDYDMIICAYNKTRNRFNKQIRTLLGFRGDPKPGERLICLQNDPDLGLFNGQLMTVTRCRQGKTDRLLVIDGMDDMNREYRDLPVLRKPLHDPTIPRNYTRGKALFDYGYAMTAHKAQGSEWENVAVLEQNCRGLWKVSRWRYTAATRASDRLDYFCSF